MAYRVLVTEPIHSDAIDYLSEFADVRVGERKHYDNEDALIQDLNDFDAALTVLSNPVTARVISSLKRTKIIANFAVGYNNIDVEAAKKHGIRVSNTPDVLSEATSDIAMALLLGVARKIAPSDADLRKGLFDGWHPEGYLGMELTGKRAAIIGMGRIGTCIARRLKGFGIQIGYHNRTKVATNIESELGAQFFEDADELLKVSDFIFMSCPLTPETHHFIDKRRLGLLHKNAIIINTGRGPLIDEAELAKSLHENMIFGAGLDVFEKEPEVHPLLLSAPNTLLLPHIGSATDETRRNMGLLAAKAIRFVLTGESDRKLTNLIC
jgi:glyoxylate reductase